MSLISKIKYHSLLSDYFKKISGYLEDGFYVIQGNKVIKTEKNGINFCKIFNVKSDKKIKSPYKEGTLFVTKYKYGFLSKEKAYYFVHDKERYNLFKSNYFKYRTELVYPTFDLEFCDEDSIVIAPIISGTIYKDLSHFNVFIDNLFEYANKAGLANKTTIIFENEYILPWYVQHGDCKNANIVWQDENLFTMIDLEAIDIYPPLYDVLYYLFISKKEDSISILKSDTFYKKVCAFYKKTIKEIPNNILDITLANYAYYTSSKLKEDSELYEFEFYLYWRKYDSFDEFPLTKMVLNEYEEKLIKYKIK